MHKLINVYIYRFRGRKPLFRLYLFTVFSSHPCTTQNKQNKPQKASSSVSSVCRSSRESPEQIRSIDRRDNDSMTRKFAESFKTHFPCQHMHATTPTKKRVTRGLCACSSCCLSRTVTFGLRLAEGGAAAAGGGWVADAWKTVRA